MWKFGQQRLASGVVLFLVQVASGSDVFVMEMMPEDASSFTISGSNLRDVVARGVRFFESNLQPGTASLNYADCPGAITLAVDISFTPIDSISNLIIFPGQDNVLIIIPQFRTNYSATLNIPAAGSSRTFTATNAPTLEKQVKSYLKKNADEELGDLQKKVAANSAIAISDGTPHSSTAFLADMAYDLYANDFEQTRQEAQSPAPASSPTQLYVAPDFGTIDAGRFHGTSSKLPIAMRFPLTERVDLALHVTPNFIEIEDSKLYQVGMGLGFPVKIVMHSTEHPWFWRVTPSVGAIASWSEDFNAGGWILQGGLTSLTSYKFKYFTLSMGNHFSWFESTPLSMDGYDYKPDVTQQIIKNGLNVSVPLGQRWIVQAYGIHTHFIQHAAVDDYYTVGANVGFRFYRARKTVFENQGQLFAGVYSDLADGYDSLRFRVGNTWKF